MDKRLTTLSDLNFAIDQSRRDNGIEIPFPQRNVHIGSGADVTLRRTTRADAAGKCYGVRADRRAIPPQ